jgi:hypothetical protein
MWLDILIKWNRWGSNPLASGRLRQVTPTITPFLHSEEVVTLSGLRRVGKSTVLYQLMDTLAAEDVDPKAMLHINFEEPALAPHLTLDLLDSLYDTYRTNVYPQGKAYLFLDEIQNIPAWERWVRARNETEDIKIFITGSSSKLMSRELATLLTGRYVNFNIHPLSLSELLDFFSIQIPQTPWPFTAPAEIAHTINFYLKWGSLPKIVLADSDIQREKLLDQYIDDILLKDIAMRHSIRDVQTLRALMVHLLTQTGSLISFTRLSNVFNVSTMLANNYCQYIQEGFLVDLAPFFSLKVSERQRNPQKIYATDLGMRNQASLSTSPDLGKSLESLVFNTLKQQRNHGIFYWKGHGEIDFVVRRGNSITHLIQVMAEGLEDAAVMTREISALQEGMEKFPQTKAMIITNQRNLPVDLSIPKPIQLIPLWQFLLNSQL